MILRDRDANTAWHEEADSTREERRYYAQNWRADVVALLTDTGKMVEWVKYSSYGVPFALPAGDTDSDGDFDSTDLGNIGGTYDVREDVSLDGAVDTSDAQDALTINNGYVTLGRGVLSNPVTANRRGYAGYEYDPTFEGAGRHMYHVRHRVYDADVGRWTRRDPLGYVDGMSLYEYAASDPVSFADPFGLDTAIGLPGCGPGCGQPGDATPPWTPPPGIPTCGAPEDYQQIQQALQALTVACPGITITWKQDSSCPSGSATARPVGKCKIEIKTCIGPSNPHLPNNPRDCQKQLDAILHELTHAQQACSSYGLCAKRWRDFRRDWNREENAICREVDAYCKETPQLCPGGVPGPNALNTICIRACGSLYEDGSRKWDKCVATCRSIAAQCGGGIYTPPPPSTTPSPPPDSCPPSDWPPPGGWPPPSGPPWGNPPRY